MYSDYATETVVRMLNFCYFKHKTAYEMRISDWSSDVCSSDLRHHLAGRAGAATGVAAWPAPRHPCRLPGHAQQRHGLQLVAGDADLSLLFPRDRKSVV